LSYHLAESSRRLAPLLAIVVVGTIGSVVAPLTLDLSGGFLVPSLSVGAMAGATGLLAAWCVLGSPGWIARHSLAAGVLAVFGLSFYVGLSCARTPAWEAREYFADLLTTPLDFLTLEIPIWALRLACGCRVIHTSEPIAFDTRRLRQFGIRHLLVAMIVAAVALALARPETARALAGVHDRTWLGVLASCGGQMLWAGVFVVPSVWLVLLAENPGRATVVFCALTLPVVLIASIVFAAISGASASSVFVFFLWLNGAQLLVLLGGLGFARHCGYVVVTQEGISPRDTRPQPDDDARREAQAKWFRFLFGRRKR
jgi:hypothetical protein